MRRKDREQTTEFAKTVMDPSPYGVVSMCDGSNAPYCVPLSLVRDGDKLYFHAALEGKKTELLRQNPAVCVCFADGVKPIAEKFTTAYRSAIVKGNASEITDDREKIHALRLICQKYAPENLSNFDEAISRSLDRTAVWAITIDNITGKSKKEQ